MIDRAGPPHKPSASCGGHVLSVGAPPLRSVPGGPGVNDGGPDAGIGTETDWSMAGRGRCSGANDERNGGDRRAIARLDAQPGQALLGGLVRLVVGDAGALDESPQRLPRDVVAV